MKILRTMAVAAVMASAAWAWAGPARPGTTITAQQPDGSQVTLQLAGDEFCHYFLTPDHRIAVEHDGAYYFATVGPDGLLAPSDMLASAPANRTAQQAAAVERINTQEILQAVSRTSQASPMMKARAEQAIDMTPAAALSRAENTSAGIGIMPKYQFPTNGQVKGLVFLVEYPDCKFMDGEEAAYEYFDAMLNEPGFARDGAVGSARDYYVDASHGTFEPHFDIFGPIMLPHERAYYGRNAGNQTDVLAYEMVIDAAKILYDQGFDFTPYDVNEDGSIDNVFLFYAGRGEADSAIAETVWPHQYRLSWALGTNYGLKMGDLWLNNYACSNELARTGAVRDGVGSFIHEFTHVLGLPDIYDTSAADSDVTPGPWSILDMGPYNGNGRVPPQFSSWERNAMNWIDPIVIEGPCNIELPELQSSNKAYIILTPRKEEFFMIENRQKVPGTWDSQLPYHGMLIWHIEYNASRWEKNIVNTIATRQYADLIEAGGRTGHTTNVLKTFPFPGLAKVTSYGGFVTRLGVNLGLPITEIKESADGIITAKVDGGVTEGISSAIAPEGMTLEGRVLSAEAPFEVYDMAGRCMVRGQSSAELPSAGVYMVKQADGRVSKLSVR